MEKTSRYAVLEKLTASADPAYREFHSRLLPGTDRILGVRTPVLRGIAKELVRQGWREYINQVSLALSEGETAQTPLYYDERIIWALCICGGCKSWEEAAPFVRDFIPVIDNWAVCDIFCGSLKAAGKCREAAWEFLQEYLVSEKEYEIRFGLVMLLSHFADDEYADRALAAIDRIRHRGYYARMAAAWAVSVYYVKMPERTEAYLEKCRLDDWTYNKALQKITESNRVDKETKARIRAMKRR